MASSSGDGRPGSAKEPKAGCSPSDTREETADSAVLEMLQDVLATFPPKFRDIPCKVPAFGRWFDAGTSPPDCQPLLFDLAFPCIERRSWKRESRCPISSGVAPTALSMGRGLPTSTRFSRRSKKAALASSRGSQDSNVVLCFGVMLF